MFINHNKVIIEFNILNMTRDFKYLSNNFCVQFFAIS